MIYEGDYIKQLNDKLTKSREEESKLSETIYDQIMEKFGKKDEEEITTNFHKVNDIKFNDEFLEDMNDEELKDLEKKICDVKRKRKYNTYYKNLLNAVTNLRDAINNFNSMVSNDDKLKITFDTGNYSYTGVLDQIYLNDKLRITIDDNYETKLTREEG